MPKSIFFTWFFAGFAAFSVLFVSVRGNSIENDSPDRMPEDVIFEIGDPDAMGREFRYWIDWEKIAGTKTPFFRYVVGENRPRDWYPMHISTRDMKNAGLSFTSEIEFTSEKTLDVPAYFVIGAVFAHPTEPSLIKLKINGFDLEPKRQPLGPEENRYDFNPTQDVGYFESVIIEIPPEKITAGQNVISMTLDDGSWLFFDYLALRLKPEPLPRVDSLDLFHRFQAGPMKDVGEILFVVRKPGNDEHWYANFGYYAADENMFPFEPHAGAALCLLNPETKQVNTIFEDKQGSLRDPQIHYDGQKVIFSYLPAGKRHYNLYEINIDGTGLRQITTGDWDDIEPTYTASGDIIFCSSRCKRWVQCWLTPVATIHRCGPNGENIRELSSNIEHDNTPWPLSNGQILYMRWEYVDRSQVHYHHLWTMNPDGTRQAVFYGNQEPGIVMLDAKPIIDSSKIVTIFSPGHGITEHYGKIAVVDPRLGPDNPQGACEVSLDYNHADPWAFSDHEFMTAARTRLLLVDAEGREQTLFELPQSQRDAGYWIHEPRPVITRVPEVVIADQTSPETNTGKLAMVNIYQGRKMAGISPGTVKELLVVETLPEPIHYSGGMDQISAGGTFTLERIFGTVPVEPDGSAFFELPASRTFFFIAMDQNDKPIKRMHSFTSVMPGETTSCIGCHENRTATPDAKTAALISSVVNRPPAAPKPITDIPDVFDFPRDIQPILDKHCVSCHSDEKTDAGVNLAGYWGPLYSRSYITLSTLNLFGDNRNRPESNFAPYEIGSSASKLYKLIEEKHQGAELSEQEKKVVKYWLELGGNYAGTYAANGTGLIGWPYRNKMLHNDQDWPETRKMFETIVKRCDACHTSEKNMLLAHALSIDGGRYNRHIIFNLSDPEKSLILRAPLAKEAGGTGRCPETVFANQSDVDYQVILAGIQRGRRYILEESNRFCMEPFVANYPYVREMIRYGVLPKNFDPKTPVNPYETDRRYWELLWKGAGFPSQ